MFFSSKKSTPKVIEVEVPRKAPLFSKEIKESLAALPGHPGFEYLLNRLKFEQAVLATKLKNERHESMRDVEFLQSGIFWTNWLRGQLDKVVFRPEPRAFDALPDETVLLDELPPLPESIEVIE